MVLVLSILAAILIIFGGASLFMGYKLATPKRTLPSITPADWELRFEDFSAQGKAGAIKGWLFPTISAQGWDAPFIVLVHGRDENRAYVYSDRRLRLDASVPCPFTVERLVARLVSWSNVVTYDQRAHGESEGRRSTFGYGEGEDIQKVIDYLVERRGAKKIALVGWSLGGSAAILEAANDPRVAAVVVDSSFAVASELLENAARRMGYPAWLMSFGVLGMRFFGMDINKARPIDQIGGIKGPILIIHGEKDPLIPVEQAERLQAAASDAQLWVVPGVGHCEAISCHTDEYVNRVEEFLKSALGVEQQ